MRSSDKTTRRRANGHTIIELGCIAGLLVFLSGFCANIGIVALGSSINDSASRDAARAAAQGSSLAQAQQLAQATLRAHIADGYFVTTPTIDTSNFVYEDYNGTPPADTSPFVSVTTSNQVRIPAPILYFGNSFGRQSSTITFTRTYSFPIVKTTLYLN